MKRVPRPLAVLTLAIFAWHVLGLWKFPAWAQAPPPASTSRSAEEKFGTTLAGAKRVLDELEGSWQDGRPLAPGLGALQRHRQAIEALDGEIRRGFLDTEQRLQNAGLPAEILDRHRQVVANYDANLTRFKQALAAIRRLEQERDNAERSGDRAGVQAKRRDVADAVRDARRHLQDVARERPHRPLDPHNLPRRTPKPSERKPRLTRDQFTEFRRPIHLAQAGGASPLVLAQATADVPRPEDVAETADVQFTKEIRDLAAQLDRNPVKIYTWVRNNIDVTPTYGSIQGAPTCLASRLCNDVDTASLLIALLRASGIAARYAVGTIEIPIAQLMNWAGGFTDAQAALSFVASGGTPVQGLLSGGQIVAGRLEHVWVEAFVDYVPSRGAVHRQGDTWVPMDASFKQFTHSDGIDLAQAMSFDAQQFLDQTKASATVDATTGSVAHVDAAFVRQAAQAVQNQLLSFATARGVGRTVGDVVGKRTIITDSRPVLASVLPYAVVVRANAFSTVPDSLRHTIAFEVGPPGLGLAYATSLPDIAGKRLTLGYSAATAADEETLKSFLPPGSPSSVTPADLPTSIPAYLVRVRPELRIQGQVVATGPAVGLGATQEFRIVVNRPQLGPDAVDNDIVAGTYRAIVLNLGADLDPAAALDQTRSVLTAVRAGNLAGVTKDDVIGQFLHGAGLLYWANLGFIARLAAKAHGVTTSRVPSLGFFIYDVSVGYLFGVPARVSSGALITDVDLDVQVIGVRNGDPQAARRYMGGIGIAASRMESAIYDEVLNQVPTGAGISAAQFLEFANQQGIPIYTIDRGNVQAILPRLQVSNDVKADIEASVAAGKIVTVPEREMVKDGFTGVGYLVIDPETGSGAYLIAAGLAGGGFQLPPLHPLLLFFLAVLLIALSFFAPVIAAVLTLALILYDFVSQMQKIARDNPNLSDDQFNTLVGLLAFFAIVAAALAVAALFVTAPPLAVALIIGATLVWTVYSIIGSEIAAALARIRSRLNENATP